MALETLGYHELRIYNETIRKFRPISYYRTPAGVEIDFVVETALRRPNKPPQVVAIEVKRSDRWQREWAKPMLNLAGTANLVVKRMIGVYCGKRTYRFGDVWVYPVRDFIRLLAAGEFFWADRKAAYTFQIFQNGIFKNVDIKTYIRLCNVWKMSQ